MEPQNMPPELARIAQGRDYLLTDEMARAFGRSGQAARKNYCLTGHSWGIKPRKVGGRLLWPVVEVARVLTEGA
ncbi:hypothetical protein GALL_231850 [mine drainage metagenome]|uniref:DNA-binding protein n=1 Tax=mine drainage metagenome TaxID=410659 RepID=A0A1J5RFE7_9ZZZZ